MKKILLSVVLFGSMLIFISCTGKIEPEAGCELECQTISNICPAEITYDECKIKCDDCGIELFDEIENVEDCNKVQDELSKCNVSKREQNSSNYCELACNNYNNQCLTQVPNATQELFEEGFQSCMDLCESWSSEKVGCMVDAQDCPSMTEVCGL